MKETKWVLHSTRSNVENGVLEIMENPCVATKILKTEISTMIETGPWDRSTNDWNRDEPKYPVISKFWANGDDNTVAVYRSAVNCETDEQTTRCWIRCEEDRQYWRFNFSDVNNDTTRIVSVDKTTDFRTITTTVPSENDPEIQCLESTRSEFYDRESGHLVKVIETVDDGTRIKTFTYREGLLTHTTENIFCDSTGHCTTIKTDKIYFSDNGSAVTVDTYSGFKPYVKKSSSFEATATQLTGGVLYTLITKEPVKEDTVEYWGELDNGSRLVKLSNTVKFSPVLNAEYAVFVNHQESDNTVITRAYGIPKKCNPYCVATEIDAAVRTTDADEFFGIDAFKTVEFEGVTYTFINANVPAVLKESYDAFKEKFDKVYTEPENLSVAKIYDFTI